MFNSFGQSLFTFSMKAYQRMEQQTTKNRPENSCESTGLLKGMRIIRELSQQRRDLGALFAGLYCGATIYLQALALGDSTTVRHDRTKSTHASVMIKATLKGKVLNTWLKGTLVTSWP